MIGIILLSHGPLAKGLYESSQIFIGYRKNIAFLILESEDDPSVFGLKIEKKIEEMKEYMNILIMSDIPGGSPANQSLFVKAKNSNIRIVSGMNLIMVIEAALFCENMTIDELCTKIIEGAKESILQLGCLNEGSLNDMESVF